MNELIRQARQTDLVEWLHKNNEPLKRIGQWWYIDGCDSLRIQGNKWYRHSQNKGGNSIDFLVDYYNLSPKEAISRLTQFPICPKAKNGGGKERNIKEHLASSGRFDFNSISLACDQRRIIAYLSKTRRIAVDIVLAEIRKGFLFQESQTGNAIFAMTDETCEIVGAEVVGTLSYKNIRFKGIKAGSTSGYGYTVGQRRNPRFILYFESAIDVLSFITIMRSRSKPLTACLLVSMAGLKYTIIQNTLQAFGNSAVPVLCADNDKAGADFSVRCLKQFPSAILKQPDKTYKDWNDQLLFCPL